MDRSDTAGSAPHGELIRDFGRRRAWRTEDATCEVRLMECAGDPLLVWELLSRREDPDGPPGVLPHLPAEATIALARDMSSRGTLEQASLPGSAKQYAWGGPSVADAHTPLPFEPSGEDHIFALDLGFSREARSKTRMGWVFLLFIATALFTAFPWFLLLLVLT